MKKANNWFLFLLIGILFFPSFSFSQQNDIDSLENIIATTTVDSQKVKAKYTLYKKIIRKDFAKAERLVQEGFALSKKINWNWGIGNGLLQLATIHYYKGELALGVEKIKASIAIFNQIGADISPMITNLAAFYQAQGQIDSAEYYYLQAIDAFQATNQVANSLIVLNNLSAIYSKKGQYKKALKIYEDAKTKALSIGDSTIAYSLNSNIANSHLDLGNYAKAIERFSENLSYYEQIGDIDRQALTLSNIGGTYLEWKETQKALTFFERALVIRQKIGHPPTISKSLLATADAQYELGNYALALPKLEQALAIQEKVKDKSVRANILKSLAKNQLKLGQYKKGLKNLQIAEKEALALKEHLLLAEIYLNYADLYSQPDLGFEIEKSIDIEDILQKAKASIDKTDDLEGQQRIYTALTKWANKNQQYQTGLAYSNKLLAIKDSLYSSEQIRSMEEMRNRFELSQKEQENAFLLKENELIAKNNQLYIIIISLLVALVGGLVFLYNKLRTASGQLKMQKNLLDEQNKSLKELNNNKDRFFSIIAHDLRSPITSFQGVGAQIRYFLKKKDFSRLDEIGQSIETSSTRVNTLLDNLLNWTLNQTGAIPYKPQTINLEDTIEDIIDLFEHSAAEKQIVITADIKASNTWADARALNVVFRNLLSNAIKFTPEKGKIEISVKKAAENVQITIHDTGVGMDTTQLNQLFDMNKSSTKGTKGEKGTGLGLLLCRDLLAANKGKIDVTSQLGKGSTFKITLPQQQGVLVA